MYDFKNKRKNIQEANKYMLAKTASMFEYSGLPETIPAHELEKIIQTHGFAFITRAPDGELYAFAGTMGGEMDAYGNPQDIIIANTYLKFNKTLNIAKDGVLIKNDDFYIGLMPLYEKANTFLVENDINMMLWGYNSRTQKLMSAPDDKTKESADSYIKKIIDGDLSIIADNAMFDGVKVQAAGSQGAVTVQQMTEYHQYIKANMFNEVGISANFNMKKERLITAEVNQEDSLFPLVYNMMQNRISGIEALNKMFDLSVEVDFGSVWHFKNKKLVDGVIDKEEIPDAANQSNGLETSGNSDSNSGDNPEKETLNDTGNGNGNGGEATTTESGDETNQGENQGETQSDDSGREQTGSEFNPDLAEETESDSASAAKNIAELEAIISDENSSDEDKQAAKALLDEMQG